MATVLPIAPRGLRRSADMSNVRNASLGARLSHSPGASEAGKVSAILLFSLLLAGLALLRKRA